MGSTTRRNVPLCLVLSVFLSAVLSSCGSSAAKATATPVVAGIFTAAFNTFEAKRATEAAMTPPTVVASPTPFPTFPPPAPLPTLSFAASTPLASGGANCDDAQYIADVTIPDKTNLDPGQKFTKTWLVQNTGTCPWTTSYKLVHLDGLAMEGADTYVPVAVPVGQQVQLSVNMRAPTSSGQYYGRWKLRNAQDQAFGSILSVVIKVVLPEETAIP